jgi:hypothetical protein
MQIDAGRPESSLNFFGIIWMGLDLNSGIYINFVYSSFLIKLGKIIIKKTVE